jgi:multidrug efflux pump subunit AcrA (membrane-fusion protein)
MTAARVALGLAIVSGIALLPSSVRAYGPVVVVSGKRFHDLQQSEAKAHADAKAAIRAYAREHEAYLRERERYESERAQRRAAERTLAQQRQKIAQLESRLRRLGVRPDKPRRIATPHHPPVTHHVAAARLSDRGKRGASHGLPAHRAGAARVVTYGWGVP